MKPSLDTLFEAVVNDPDADAPRLAYADACEAQGEVEHAEFIRLQIEAAAAKRAGRHDDASRTFDRRFSLKRRFSERWAGPIREHVKSVQFFRGFVEWIDVDAKKFLEQADELYAMAPIRRLKFTGAAPVIDALRNSRHLARLVSLSLNNQNIGDDGVAMIARSPYVSKLALLDLSGTGVTGAGVTALAASPNIPSLRSVLGLPKEFQEDLWSDQGQTINVVPPPEAPQLEEKYGRKRWLHPFEETNWRGVDEDEL